MQGDEELLVGLALRVPAKLIGDIVHRLIERIQFIQFGQRALHQFGILTE